MEHNIYDQLWFTEAKKILEKNQMTRAADREKFS